MEVKLVKIGNSQGIRIPKAIIQQIGIGNTVRMVVEDGIIKLIPKKELSKRDLALLSENSLAKTWNDPREDKAWESLQ